MRNHIGKISEAFAGLVNSALENNLSGDGYFRSLEALLVEVEAEMLRYKTDSSWADDDLVTEVDPEPDDLESKLQRLEARIAHLENPYVD